MYLGVDYYPEHWDENMIDNDLDNIIELGSNVIRIGEFAWHMMENVEGNYNFSYFDRVIEKAKAKNLSTMPLTFSCFCASVANTSEQIIIIPPTIATTARVFPIFPFVKDKTFPALKNTPEPITMPTTIQIAVSSPYFLVNFSKILSIPLLKNYV